MINIIRSIQIKGNTLDQPLTGRDIFIGPNGSGKSTRLQALQIAMLGYVPGKGKENRETFKLSSGDEMTAGLKLDHFSFDRTITRTVKLNGDGSKDIKYPESLTVSPNKGEKNATQMNARITAEIGNFPVVFDFQEFLNKSDAERRKFIYALSPITNDTWNKSSITAHLEKNLLSIGLKTTNYDLYEATRELVYDALGEWPEDYDLSAGLQSMLSWVETQQKAWNKKKNDATGAVRELAEMKNQLEQTDRDIVAKKEELKELRQQYTDVHGQIKACQEIKRQWEQKKGRREQLKAEIQRLTDELARPDETNYEGKMAAFQSQIKQTDIAAESESIQKEIDALRAQRDAKTVDLDEIKPKIDKLSAELHTMNTVLKNIKEKGAGICVIHHQISCEKDFSKFTDHVAEKGPKLEEQINDLISQREKLKADIRELQEKENVLESNKRILQRSFMDETRENDRLRNEIEAVRKSEQAARQTRQNAENKKAMMKEELDRLQAEPMPTLAPLEILEPQFNAIAAQVGELEYVIEEKEKAKITLSNSQTAMISASKAQYYHTACKNLSDALGTKGIQGELVKGIVGPIEDMINENLRLMGISHPVFFSTESETGKEVFQFGWVKEDRQTNFDVLSTGEQLMFLSAFLVTLLERANPPLKVLALDNIENLDNGNFRNLLSGLSALSHKLDNILIAGVVDARKTPGWKIWQLSPESEEEVENA